LSLEGENMRVWWGRHFWIISSIFVFFLLATLGNIFFFIVIFTVLANCLLIRLVYKFPFLMIEFICICAYFLACIICLLFIELILLKALICLLGTWYVLCSWFPGKY